MKPATDVDNPHRHLLTRGRVVGLESSCDLVVAEIGKASPADITLGNGIINSRLRSTNEQGSDFCCTKDAFNLIHSKSQFFDELNSNFIERCDIFFIRISFV